MIKLLVPHRDILPQWPAVIATPEQIDYIRHGRNVNFAEFTQAKLVRVFDSGREDSELVCIAERIAGTLFHPKVVLL